MLTLAPPHYGGHDDELLSLSGGGQPVDDLRDGLAADRAPAPGTVRLAGAGEEDPEVVMDLGDRPDRRTGIPRGGLLVDRDRRRESLDRVDVRFLHLLEELPRVARQRLDITSLPFGIDRIEGERRLARTAQPRYHDELPARHGHCDILEIVFPGASDDEVFTSHSAALPARHLLITLRCFPAAALPPPACRGTSSPSSPSRISRRGPRLPARICFSPHRRVQVSRSRPPPRAWR